MRSFLSHLFVAFVVYWSSGVWIVKRAEYSHPDSTVEFKDKLLVSLLWPYVVYKVTE